MWVWGEIWILYTLKKSIYKTDGHSSYNIILYKYEIQKCTTTWGSKNTFNTISSSESIQSQVLNLRVSRPLDCETHYVLVVQVVLGQARLGEETLLTVWGPLFGYLERDPVRSQDQRVRCPLDQHDICKSVGMYPYHHCITFTVCVMECTLTIGWECTPTNPLFKTFSLWFYTPRSPGVLLCCGCSFDLLSPDNSRTRWYVRRGSVSRWKMCLHFQQNKKRRGTREGRCHSKTMMSTEASEFDWTLNTRMKVWSSFYY